MSSVLLLAFRHSEMFNQIKSTELDKSRWIIETGNAYMNALIVAASQTPYTFNEPTILPQQIKILKSSTNIWSVATFHRQTFRGSESA